ncbi:MAG TPA: hypothetical protein VGR40_07640, partial [Candidatus Binatus sp.]|nr:hypothetical protein [Candidatus Binatus sp.]
MNAGETYTIDDIKPGTKPTFRVEQNPNALVTYDTPPGKLTIVGAEAGHWTVNVINAAGHEVIYDVNAFAVATPGAPLKPGKAPSAISDTGLEEHIGAPTSTVSALPELATIPSSHPSSAATTDSSYSVTLPDKASPSNTTSWDAPADESSAAQSYGPSQSAVPLRAHPAEYRNDP